MTDSTSSPIARLNQHRELLVETLRGIEKEGLRVDTQGSLAHTPHPCGLGAALTHSRITTDYSEVLLEFITSTHNTVNQVLTDLEETHQFFYRTVHDEVIWNQSMPVKLPADADIPIAWYGTSHTGMLKHVYRRGLAQRYGKRMQCIAGVHYNFSLKEEIWALLDTPGSTTQEKRSTGYFRLIRNFTRYAWLLMYFFGATPAVSKSFVGNKENLALQTLDSETLYLPYATSLRMSDLGYQNKAQAGIELSYNDLHTFLKLLHQAVTQPWPGYKAIGTHRQGEWIQLNTNILQIENEYYSSIRPKRTTRPCERPINALDERGVQYVEMRCLDIDPFEPIGISSETSHFLDAFLLFCAVTESPLFSDEGRCPTCADNFSKTVNFGRQPNLMLQNDGEAISLNHWGQEIIERIYPYAEALDMAYNSSAYTHALEQQRHKLIHVELTPSAQFLTNLQDQQASFEEYSFALSQAHAKHLRALPLSTDKVAQYTFSAQQSLIKQAKLEANSQESFDAYVARYHQALKPPKN